MGIRVKNWKGNSLHSYFTSGALSACWPGILFLVIKVDNNVLQHVLLIKTKMILCFFLILVCQRIVEEIEREIEKVTPDKKVDVGSYRLDHQGEVKKSTVSITVKLMLY